LLTGNTSATLTDSTTNFIGSTFQFPFIAKTNNSERYRISSNGLHSYTLPNTSETGATFTANSLTTGKGILATSSSLTSGSIINVTSTSTAANAGAGIRVAMSGTNAGAYTVTGVDVAVNNANTNGGISISQGGKFVANTGTGGQMNAYGVIGQTTGTTSTAGLGGQISVGGYFTAGQSNSGTQYGVYGEALGSNPSTSYGGYFKASQGQISQASYGVYGWAISTNSSMTTTGGYFKATQTAGTGAINTAIYGTASGATTNYGIIIADVINNGFGATSPVSTVEVNGSLGVNIVYKTANYTLTATDNTVVFNGTSLTATLPAASGAAKRVYVIVNQNATTLTISTYKDFTNSNATTVGANSAIKIHSDGTNWIRTL
jgi:hypothetical protein